ncbi:hypothetical protein ASD11_13505 [Aeromicrobium sp. Root495]|uniref:hypothetical protein n=1 Tax=Aeromicrobium sp. Root495 TaxID=1736550 RepID=UPI0006FC9862|nr:hypothetical protein [Aeromicrobium sp. Root495]KQY60456.1 hypothetical protein ASD11_13505 [Aeromicrobium sp. Root495]
MSWFCLLTPRQTTAIMLEGHDVVEGPVVPLEEAAYGSADDARAAFGHADPAVGAGRFVDFLVIPEIDEPLRTVRVEDGVLAPTRAPSGTEYWRMEPDGRRIVISYYDTPAYGWRNGRGPVRPADRPGLRARWNGLDLVAAFEDGVDGVHLVAVGDETPEGFTWTKVGVSRRTVPVEECELYLA